LRGRYIRLERGKLSAAQAREKEIKKFEEELSTLLLDHNNNSDD